MKKLTIVVVLGVILLIAAYFKTSTHNTTPQSLEQKVESFADALEQGNATKASSLALELASADYSDTPLDAQAQAEMKVEMAVMLAEQAEYETAISVLSPVISDDEADYLAAIDPDIGAYYRHSLVDNLLIRADINVSARQYKAAVADLEDAHTHLDEILDIDKFSLYFLYKDLSEQHGNVAIELLDAGDFEGAEKHLNAAHEFEQRQGISGFEKIITLQHAAEIDADGLFTPDGEITQTVGASQTSAQYNKKRMIFWTRRAEDYSNSGQYQEALRDLVRACLIYNGPHGITDAEAAELEEMTAECNLKLDDAYRKLKGIGPDVEIFKERRIIKSPPTGFFFQDTGTAETFGTIQVFYGTNRKINPRKRVHGDVDRKTVYTADMVDSGSPLQYGTAVVTVPKRRKPGKMPRPFIGGAKDGVHVVLKQITPMEGKSEFAQELAESVALSPREEKEAFVFIHGHAVSFASSARRTAQLAVDLDIRNGATFFSWPVGGSVIAYKKSEDQVDDTVPYLVEFLETVHKESGATKIHILAHSMGNRILYKALPELREQGLVPKYEPFDQIIWASPDVDAKQFGTEVAKIKDMARNMTLYASRKDKALSLSRWLKKKRKPRAGQTPPLPIVIGAIDNVVDTSEVGHDKTDVIAHADYTNGALSDLQSIVWLSLAPKSRCMLTTKTDSKGGTYWAAQKIDTNCNDTAFGQAVNAIRHSNVGDPIIFMQGKMSEAQSANEQASVQAWEQSLDVYETYLKP